MAESIPSKPFEGGSPADLPLDDLPSGRDLPPRSPLRRSGCGFWTGLLLTIFAIALILVGAIFTQAELRRTILLSGGGEAATGVITQIDETGRSPSELVTVRFEYTAAVDGESIRLQAESQVPRSQIIALEIGQPVSITYLPADPHIATIEAGGADINWGTLIFFGRGAALVLFFGLWGLIRGFRDFVVLQKLKKEGVLTRGVILDRWRGTEQDPEAYIVAYAFEVHIPRLGYPWITRAEFNRAAYEVLDRGEPVRVRYLPDAPDQCQLFDFPG